MDLLSDMATESYIIPLFTDIFCGSTAWAMQAIHLRNRNGTSTAEPVWISDSKFQVPNPTGSSHRAALLRFAALVLAGNVWMQYFFQELDDIGNSKPSWIQPGEVRNILTVKSLLLSQIFWYFCYIFCFSFFLGQESYPYPCSWETSAKICEGFVTAWCKVVGFFDASGGDLLLHMEVENRTSGCLIVLTRVYINKQTYCIYIYALYSYTFIG